MGSDTSLLKWSPWALQPDGWSTQEPCAERDGCLADVLLLLRARATPAAFLLSAAGCYSQPSIFHTWSLPLIMMNNDDGIPLNSFKERERERRERASKKRRQKAHQSNTALHLMNFFFMSVLYSVQTLKTCCEKQVWCWYDYPGWYDSQVYFFAGNHVRDAEKGAAGAACDTLLMWAGWPL